MTTYTRALDTKVLIVAVVNEDIRDWAAYIGAVEGKNHDAETPGVAERGTKVSKEMAEMVFPYCAKYNWRC